MNKVFNNTPWEWQGEMYTGQGAEFVSFPHPSAGGFPVRGLWAQCLPGVALGL